MAERTQRKRTTARQRRQLAFEGEVYEALRDYQTGKLQGNGTAVGHLGQPLTAAFDRIVAASKELAGGEGLNGDEQESIRIDVSRAGFLPRRDAPPGPRVVEVYADNL